MLAEGTLEENVCNVEQQPVFLSLYHQLSTKTQRGSTLPHIGRLSHPRSQLDTLNVVNNIVIYQMLEAQDFYLKIDFVILLLEYFMTSLLLDDPYKC